MRLGYITPSRFKDVMTVAKGYKTKDDLELELATLADDQHKREQKNRTNTQIYKDTEDRIKQLPELIANWSPVFRFGDTAKTYATEIALGRFAIEIPGFRSDATDHGNRFEVEARELYQQLTGYQFPKENFRMVSEKYPFIAGEADGNIYGRGRRWGGEIKCPYNPVNHFNNLTGEKDQHRDTYIWQVVGYCSPWMYGWEGYTFISFNPYFPGEGKISYQDYERNAELEQELEEALLCFEMELVRPLVEKMKNLFKADPLEQWRF